jgi:hypothetical protein
MENRFSDVKQRFHVVQLALFNAQVLSAVQHNAEIEPQGTCAALIDQCARDTIAAFPPAPSTVNQSLFFGMAYLSIVWLSESLSREQVAKASNDSALEDIFLKIEAKGPRKFICNADYLGLIRNALSHGSVEINKDDCYVFWDQNKSKQKGGIIKENEKTYLTMESSMLGELTMKYYQAVSSIIYNDRPPRTKPRLV